MGLKLLTLSASSFVKIGTTVSCFQESGNSPVTIGKSKGKVRGIRWCSAWPRCSSPWHWPLSLWREGAHHPGTQGQSDKRVTTVYLPRQRGDNSLPDVAYLHTAWWTGAWGYRKNRPNFSTPPGDRTRDLSFVSRARYRYTTESHNSYNRRIKIHVRYGARIHKESLTNLSGISSEPTEFVWFYCFTASMTVFTSTGWGLK